MLLSEVITDQGNRVADGERKEDRGEAELQAGNLSIVGDGEPNIARQRHEKQRNEPGEHEQISAPHSVAVSHVCPVDAPESDACLLP